MISVTSKSRYAVVALAELARSGTGPVPIAQVAERRGIPVQFLEQLFSTLRRAGMLDSQRGVKGGYTLARPAEEITVLEVVQALDGKVGEEGKEAGGIWAEGVEALREVFRSTTIADIAAPRGRRSRLAACTTSSAVCIPFVHAGLVARAPVVHQPRSALAPKQEARTGSRPAPPPEGEGEGVGANPNPGFCDESTLGIASGQA